MKDSDNMIEFKSLADVIEDFLDGQDDREDFDSDEFDESGIAELFEQMLNNAFEESIAPISKDELYEEIVDNFFVLIKELSITNFNFFRFASYDYCREIIVDGKEIDLDGEFSHDDEGATEALSAIDCLMADLGEDAETILKKIEKMINIRNKK